MGNFNATCFLTNLPIERDDPIVGITLWRTHSHTLCSSTALWRPLGGPIFGKYNEAGGVTPEGYEHYHAWLTNQWQIAFDKEIFIRSKYWKLETLDSISTLVVRGDSCGIRPGEIHKQVESCDDEEDADEQDCANPIMSACLAHQWAFDMIAVKVKLKDGPLVGWCCRLDSMSELFEWIDQTKKLPEGVTPPPMPKFRSGEERGALFHARMLSPQAATPRDWWVPGLTGSLMNEDIDDARMPEQPTEEEGQELQAVYRRMYAFHIGLDQTKSLMYHPSRTCGQLGYEEWDATFAEKIAEVARERYENNKSNLKEWGYE